MAIALNLYVEVTVGPGSSLSVRTTGEGSGLPTDRSHLAAAVAISVLGHDHIEVEVSSHIPVARGLGSSAALAIAAAAASGAADPLAVASSVDGHVENAAASMLGGLVGATVVDGSPRAVPLSLDSHLSFVVLVPDSQLPTSQARQVLPEAVRHGDAAFNLGRLALLLGGLADSSRLVPAAFEDRLHQPFRSSLFPQADRLMAALISAGARGACWSGAGPSLLAVCDSDSAAEIRLAGEKAMSDEGVAGRALLLEADRSGLVVEAIDPTTS